jgi:thioredoxin reductase (NADPH)
METHHKLIIIGSGPAGLTAALYAARSRLDPLLIEGKSPGGQLMGTSYVENWPGEIRILGPELMKRMKEHALHYGTQFLDQEVTTVDFTKKPFQLATHRKMQLTAQSVIIATGTESKRLCCPGESEYWGKGVSTCAVCDAAFFKDKKVVIVGGGDTAMENATFLTRFTNDITIVHILDKLTASAIMQERVHNHPAISLIYNATVSEIKGNGQTVTGIVITDQKTKKTTEMATDGIFIAVGLKPNTELFKGQLELLENGYLKVTDHTKTSVPGVFAAGDVFDSRYRQAITSAGSGCMAALDAEKYLSHL